MKVVQMVLFLYWSSCYAFFKLAGPYEVKLESMQECQDVGTHQYQFTYTIKKINATAFLLLANASYGIEDNEHISFKARASMRTSGGWGSNAYVHDGKDHCASLRDSLWELFELWYTELGIPARCPIPSGSYSMRNGMPITFRNFKMFPSLPYGRYKVEIAFYNGDTRIGCLMIKATVDEIAH